MGYLEKAEVLKSGFKEQLDKAEAVNAQLKSNIEFVDLLVTDVGAELEAREEKGYEDGLAKAGQAGGTDKIYSDAEMNEFLAPLKEKIAALEAEKQAAADALPGLLEAAKVESVAAFKLELKAKYEEQQEAETTGETGFAALLA